MKSKRFLAIVLSAMLLTAAMPAVAAAETDGTDSTGSTANAASARLLGDVNNDGNVTVSDVTTIQRYLAESESLEGESLTAADVNGDGNVAVDDATILQRYLRRRPRRPQKLRKRQRQPNRLR